MNSIFWPKFLIFSPSWKRGKLISSLFFAAFLRINFSSDRFFRKKSARELFKYRNLTEKGFLMREAQNFFTFCPLNCLKYMKKAKNCLIIVKNIIREELISSLFPCFFPKAYFFPPPGGGAVGQNIYHCASIQQTILTGAIWTNVIEIE